MVHQLSNRFSFKSNEAPRAAPRRIPESSTFIERACGLQARPVFYYSASSAAKILAETWERESFDTHCV